MQMRPNCALQMDYGTMDEVCYLWQKGLCHIILPFDKLFFYETTKEMLIWIILCAQITSAILKLRGIGFFSVQVVENIVVLIVAVNINVHIASRKAT